jgi:FixJ family two-component response regulator
MYLKELEGPSTPSLPSSHLHLAIVDDDIAVLRSLSRMLTACGYSVTAFQSAEAFTEALAHGTPDALLVDLRLPGTDGLTLLDQLRRDGHRIPMVFLSGHADVPTSVRAIRAGAVDFLEKPCDESTLLTSLARAFDIAESNRTVAATSEELRAKWQTLTPREQQVCLQVIQGRLNKQIAADLGTREKTIKVHRARVMAKMGARSLPELVRSIDRLKSADQGDAAPADIRLPASFSHATAGAHFGG